MPHHPPALDPATDATVARFFAAVDTPAPPAGLAHQLWEELMQAYAIPVAPEPVNFPPNGRMSQASSGTPLALPPSPGRWAPAQLGHGGIVLLTLVGSYVVFGSLRSQKLPLRSPCSRRSVGHRWPRAGSGPRRSLTSRMLPCPGPVPALCGCYRVAAGSIEHPGRSGGDDVHRVEWGTVKTPSPAWSRSSTRASNGVLPSTV